MINNNFKPDDIKAYNQFRTTKNTELICHAPFTNIYFNSWGHAGACWLTLDDAPKYPEKSLREIWFGPFFEDQRKNIRTFEMKSGCSICKKRIQDGVYPQVLARAYDVEDTTEKFPQIMEFELSNLCNLACIMCKGSLSSKIRKEREQLEALQSPYDNRFIDQLKEFIPHLKEARFNGGEPFLQKSCWQIWEAIAEINPSILITVATNGTLLNEKMKSILEKCRFRINVSLDSLDRTTYETIRVGSSFDVVIENLKWFGEYCRKKNTILSVMVNPMRMNWREMPDYVKWCSERGYFVWYNTIWRPRHLAIWTLPVEQLREIQKVYDEYDFSDIQPADTNVLRSNLLAFNSYGSSQIRAWIKDQSQREKEKSDYSQLLLRMKNAKDSFVKRPIYDEFKDSWIMLENRTNRVFDENVLYYYLNLQSDSELKTHVQSKDRNAFLDWVYRICDYY